MIYKILTLIVITLNLFLQPSITWTAPARDAESVIVGTTESIYKAIQLQCKDIEQDPRQLHRLVEEIIIPNTDFERMSKWVLGKNWRTADNEQRVAFINEFRHLLVRTYATAIQMASLESIRYLPARDGAKPETRIVRTEIRRPGESMVTINYYLFNSQGQWLVYDILVDGISLVNNYRSTFSEEIRKSGVSGLISVMEKKNATPATRPNADLIRKRAARACN